MQGTNLEYFAQRQDKVLYSDGHCVITSYMGAAYHQVLEDRACYEAYNFPLAELFLIAIRGITGQHHLSLKHVVTPLDDDCKPEVRYPQYRIRQDDSQSREDWYRANAYCIGISEAKSELQKFTMMLGGLNMYFGSKHKIVGGYKTAEMDYYALTHTPDVMGSVKPTPGEGENGEDWQELVNALNTDYRNLLEYPVVLETGHLRRAPYEIPRLLAGEEEMNEWLGRYKLRLVKGRKRMKVVEVRGGGTRNAFREPFLLHP